MPNTERLYYTNCYLKTFDAHIVRTSPDARGTRLYLDRTAFYPESGGQPSDQGELAGYPLLDVIDEGEEIAHVVVENPPYKPVRGTIDWKRRFDHMQQHTGQHILSAAFARSADYKTVSFHLGNESSTIDLDSDRVGSRQMDAAEDLANQVTFENRHVQISFRTAEESQRLELRKPTFREGNVRLVEIEAFDLSACGGTHVNRTGAVGLISIRKVERVKGLTRVEFVCGGRAMRCARGDYAVLGEAAQLLSTASEDVPGLITKQSQELREAGKRLQNLEKDLADFEAESLWQAAPDKNGVRVVRCLFETAAGTKAKLLAHALAKRPATIALIGVKGTPAMLLFSQSAAGRANLSDVLKQTVAQFGGKGGGTRDFAQGGGLPEENLENALNLAESLLP